MSLVRSDINTARIAINDPVARKKYGSKAVAAAAQQSIETHALGEQGRVEFLGMIQHAEHLNDYRHHIDSISKNMAKLINSIESKMV